MACSLVAPRLINVAISLSRNVVAAVRLDCAGEGAGALASVLPRPGNDGGTALEPAGR